MGKFLYKGYAVLIAAAIMLTTINGLAAQVIVTVNSTDGAIGTNCKWQQVEVGDIRSARPDSAPWNPALGTFPHYSEIVPEYQHSWVVDMPECNLVKGNRTFTSNIQQGTKFVADSASGTGFRIKHLGQFAPPRETPGGFGKLKDRLEYTFVPKDATPANHPMGEFLPNELIKVNGATKYIGFSLFFPTSYEPPELESWVIHMQVHQAGGFAPPMALRIYETANPTDPIKAQIELRTQAMKEAKEQGIESVPDTLFGSMMPDGRRSGLTLARNQWHNFVIRLEPRTTDRQAGVVIVLKEGVEIFNGRRYWGYDADTEAKEKMSIKMGVYRRRNERVQTMHFDNFTYAFTQAAAVNQMKKAMKAQKRNSLKR